MEKTNTPQTINRHTFVIKTGSFLLNTLLTPLDYKQYIKRRGKREEGKKGTRDWGNEQ
jgi:hypothetical protein